MHKWVITPPEQVNITELSEQQAEVLLKAYIEQEKMMWEDSYKTYQYNNILSITEDKKLCFDDKVKTIWIPG